jgi:uncharacterized protein (UPF0147 family)
MNDWLNDPRWRTARELLEWVSPNDAQEHPEFLERLRRYWIALESIASDQTTPSRQRELARGVLDELAYLARRRTSDSLRSLASIAEAPGAEPTTRANAHAHLESALLRLKDVIEDPNTPERVREQAIKGRRDFLAS